MSGVLLTPVTASNVDHSNGWFTPYSFHLSDLAIGSVSSEDLFAATDQAGVAALGLIDVVSHVGGSIWSVDKERFPLVAGRMLGRHVETFKHIVIPINFRFLEGFP